MALGRSEALNLGEDPIRRIFFRFAIPSILSMLAQTTAGFVDSVFIGRFVGPEGIGGITLVFPVLNFVVGFSSMIAIGGVTLAGIHSGREEHPVANNYFNVTVFLVLAFSLISTIVTWFIVDIHVLEDRFGLEHTTALLTSEYGRALTWFFMPFLMNFTLSLFVKLAGRPVAVVAVNVAGMVMNVLLDWVLVGRLGWGMTGAALATGASQVIPFLTLLVITMKRTEWRFARPRFRRKQIGALLFNGSSEFLTMASLAVSGFVYNLVIIGSLGEAGVSAYGIALQVSNVMIMLFYGVAEAIQSPVSFNYGAGLLDRVRRLRWMSTATVMVVALLFFPALFFRAELLAGIFTTHTPTAMSAGFIVKFFAVAFLMAGINIVATSYYTAINQPVLSAGLATVRSLVALLIGLAVFPVVVPGWGLWIPLVFTEVVTLAGVVVLYAARPLGLSASSAPALPQSRD